MNKFIILLIFSLIFTQSCGIYKPSDARKVPTNANDRVKKNIEEGRGFRLSNLGKSGGDFLFASSNPLWRATMQKLSFAPLGVVDYGGGIIVTDWFNDNSQKKELRDLKITVKFLSNEIRADGIKIDIHERICKIENSSISTK